MSSFYIPVEVKRLAIARSEGRCEYCRIHEQYIEYPFHIDHIISLKHGGTSVLENLAYSCPDCNFNKGSNIGTLLNPPDRTVTLLFHPRMDKWEEHFCEEDGYIRPLTEVGEATARILLFNSTERIILRRALL